MTGPRARGLRVENGLRVVRRRYARARGPAEMIPVARSHDCSLRRRIPSLVLTLVFACAFTPARSVAQEAPAPPPPASPAEEDARRAKDLGLPAAPGLAWSFHLDATLGAFGFANSLYTNPRPGQPSGDLSDNWYEATIKPALTGTYTSPESWQVYAGLSAVGESNFSAPPAVTGGEASSFGVEDLYVGWRSGKSLGLGENALDVTIGRAQYRLGHGLLIWDGASEGGSRGGYWTNARKAFKVAAIGRFRPGPHTFEAFYLERDELPEVKSHSRLWGLNYELALGPATTLGATYMKWHADSAVAPQRDGLNVYDVRVLSTPLSRVPLSFEIEWARELNGDAFRSTGWTALVAWQCGGAWKPRLSYRYAFFEGDDPATARREAFDPLFLGFYDWGSWFQGEIAGGYILTNSNLKSHQVRLHTSPSGSVDSGLMLWDFLFDVPAALGPTVTSDHALTELDWYLDWKINTRLSLTLVAAAADPGKGAQQAYGRTSEFVYGLIFLAYHY